MIEAVSNSITNNYVPVAESYFGRRIQPLLNWFAFFLAYPALTVLGNSVTFYIFLIIVYRLGFFWRKPSKGVRLLFTFFFIIIASALFAPYSDMPRHPGITNTVQILVQYSYWILVAALCIYKRKEIDFMQLSKWVFYGTIAAIIGFYLLGFEVDLVVLSIDSKDSRNGFVFTLLCCIPIVFYYLYHKYSQTQTYLWLLFFIIAMLFTNGRSGAIIIMLQSLLLLGVFKRFFRRLSMFFLAIALMPMILTGSGDYDQIMEGAAVYFEDINPRFAKLLKQEGEGDLDMDKSWLLRELMIDKGIEIYEKHPVLGVGPNGFKYYDSKFNTLSDYSRLGGHTEEYYNSRSSHNSYIQVLADFGLLGMTAFLLLLSVPILYFLWNYIRGKADITMVPIIGLLGSAFHYYAITAITGAIGWFVLGLAWAVYVKNN